MPKKKLKKVLFTDDQIRQIMLEYFFERNKNATSRLGKKSGAAVTISVIRAELKTLKGLSAQGVQSNLTYLLSQGWVEKQLITKSFPTKMGGFNPSITNYYIITAAGIDKIKGPSEFTRDRFQGIKIEATGQNIITLGDGNQINIRFREIGEELAKLIESIKASDKLDETTKLNSVADIHSIQDQLAKPKPNQKVISNLWEGIHKAASAAGLLEAAAKIAGLIASLF